MTHYKKKDCCAADERGVADGCATSAKQVEFDQASIAELQAAMSAGTLDGGKWVRRSFARPYRGLRLRRAKSFMP